MLFALNTIKKVYGRVILLGAVVVSVTVISLAQETENLGNLINEMATGGSAATEIILNPSNPITGQTVTATLQSNDFDEDKVDISWLINGSTVERGFGKKRITFTGPKTGDIMVVRVEARTPEGLRYFAQRTIQNRSISLIVEPLDSYTPDWYEGKAFPARGGKVRIYALTSFYSGNTVLSPSELVYTWNVAGDQVKSGVGETYIDYQTVEVQGNSIDVSVRISPIASNESISASTKIKPNNPQLLIYEKDSLTGIKNQKALSGRVEGKDVFTLVAEPFFFSTDRTKLTDMTYSWTVNGARASGAQTYERVFKLNSDQKGTVSVGLNIERAKKILQRASASLSIIFN